MLPALLQQVHKVRFLLDNHSTTILTAAGVGGTVATAVLTGRSTFKAAEIIGRAEEGDPNRPIGEITDISMTSEGVQASGFLVPKERVYLSKTEKTKLVWREYLPPVAMGVTTITCIIVANKISTKKIAALAVAGGISERALQEYKEKVVEKLGIRQDEKIRDEIAQDHVTANPPPPNGSIVITGSGDVLCYDDLTGRYFYSSVEKIKSAENRVNFSVIQDDYCSLSYFFDEIGLRPTSYSDMVGWNINTKGMEVKFTATMTDDKRPCLVLGYTHMPEMDYDKLWAMDR